MRLTNVQRFGHQTKSNKNQQKNEKENKYFNNHE
jgi:hypothetical protein